MVVSQAYLASHGAVEVDSNKWLGLTINHDVLADTQNDFGLSDCKSMNTPAAPGTKLYKTVPTDDVSESGTFSYQYNSSTDPLCSESICPTQCIT